LHTVVVAAAALPFANRTITMAKRQRKTSSACQKKIGVVMHEWGKGNLKMGRSGKAVTKRRQAIAIGFSECRRRGLKAATKK
jgi:hypothetical protein